MHVHNEDTENLFSITFPTPLPDDTWLPHIMEHAVLDGSQKFPARRPFFEMIKMSMATFINAMTAGYKTMYPVSSTVKQGSAAHRRAVRRNLDCREAQRSAAPIRSRRMTSSPVREDSRGIRF